MNQNEQMTEELDKFISSLPPLPKCHYELTEKEKEFYSYTGDLKDCKTRLKEKVFKFWKLYGNLITSKEMNDILKNKPEDESTEEYKAKCIITNIIDVIAKILLSTDLIEELFVMEIESNKVEVETKDNDSS